MGFEDLWNLRAGKIVTTSKQLLIISTERSNKSCPNLNTLLKYWHPYSKRLGVLRPYAATN